MIETDALIVGAGPVGLFQVFELGLLDIRAHVIDSLAAPGGQCAELYADKPIYDIPGLPLCSGQELTERLLRQIEPFGAQFHFGQEVSTVQPQADGRFQVETHTGQRFLCKTLFIAAGVGSFRPRTLKVDGAAAHEGRQLHYRLQDTTPLAGQHLLVLGGDASAVDAVLSLAAVEPALRAAQITLLHRRDQLKAEADKLSALRVLIDAGAVRFQVGQVTHLTATDGRLSSVQVIGSDGEMQTLPCDQILALLGLSPKLGPLADWGLALERKQLVVDTERFQTSVPGIFAVGDVNTYPGKRKLILCGFHEATLAAFGAAAHLFPDQRIHLQYTTTSPQLQARLGVAPATTD